MWNFVFNSGSLLQTLSIFWQAYDNESYASGTGASKQKNIPRRWWVIWKTHHENHSRKYGEFIYQGQTVNREAFEGKCSVQAAGSVECEESNFSLFTCEFLAIKQHCITSHPPYLPDLAPADLHIFPKLKMQLNGCQFNTVTEIQKKKPQKVLNSLIENNFAIFVVIIAI